MRGKPAAAGRHQRCECRVSQLVRFDVKPLWLASLLAIAGSLGVACGSSTAVPTQPEQVLSESRLKIYQSIAELRADSVSVAVVRAGTTRRVELVGGIPFTVTTVTVLQVLAGETVSSTLNLRQLGRDGVRVEGGAAPIQA